MSTIDASLFAPDDALGTFGAQTSAPDLPVKLPTLDPARGIAPSSIAGRPSISLKALSAKADAEEAARPTTISAQATSKNNVPAGPVIKEAKPKSKGKAGPLDMEKFGLLTEAQWLLTVPSRYEDYKNFTHDFNALYQGTPVMIRGRVLSKRMFDDQKKETFDPRFGARLTAEIKNDRGQIITVSAFGRPGFAWKSYHPAAKGQPGSEIVLRGTPKVNYRHEMAIEQVEVVAPGQIGKIVPIYPNIKVTKGERFAERVNANMNLLDTAAQLVEVGTGWLDRNMGRTMQEVSAFESAQEMLREMHRPSSVERGEQARRAAKLLSAWTLIRTTNKRINSVESTPKSIINITNDQIEVLKNRIPFELTGDQSRAIDGICRSLRSPLPMTGLLTGDVGSGKTLAFLVPMVAAHQAGKKTILMTPNLLLIQQVMLDFATYFPEVPVCKVTGGKGGVTGDPDKCITIGNTALLHAMKKGKIGRAPDFLVVDEQHKFSVQQREMLIDKHTNSLEATATPIPRTAALATHGAKDLFLLHQIPVVKTITSRMMKRDDAKEARNIVLRAILEKGEQASVIYPLVESDDPTMALKSVVEAAANWSRKIPMEKIAVLHGKMKDEEKNDVLDAFRRGEKRLLLASSVIEVGVTLPELKTMLVIGSDKFGVVTLHQLRGRLARKGGHGEFMMFTESDQPDSVERLQLLVNHQDGFLLAEKDAEYRGYGDILGFDGAAQSGKTRTLFLGVDIGPRDISFAVNLYEKLDNIEKASMAADAVNQVARKGETLRML